MRRNRGLSRAWLNSAWPHQVIFLWEERAISNRRVIMEGARQYGYEPKTRFVHYDSVSFLVFCFSARAHALDFRHRHLEGELVEPIEFDKVGLWHPAEDGMCNLYHVTTNQESIRKITQALIDTTGNLEPSIEAYPDRPAPIVRNTPEGRELTNLTWGMPSPPNLLAGKPDTGVTNIRNAASPHWRRWLGPANRCVVPWTEFCEWEDTVPRKTKRWFVISEARPLAFFAGIWCDWSGTRGSIKTPRAGEHSLFGFLTCPPNDIVAPIHPKAMPVILTTTEEIETWLDGPWEEAKLLQRPLPDEELVLLPV